MKFQITWPKTWKTNTNIQRLKWKRFNKNKGHCHGLSMIAPLWRPANKIHLLEAPCPRSAIHPRMGWTPEFGQKESPQKALHSPTCKTKGPKERTKWTIQGFFQVRFCSFSGCLLVLAANKLPKCNLQILIWLLQKWWSPTMSQIFPLLLSLTKVQLLGWSKLQIKSGITCHGLLTDWKTWANLCHLQWWMCCWQIVCVCTSNAIWIRTRKHYSHINPTALKLVVESWSHFWTTLAPERDRKDHSKRWIRESNSIWNLELTFIQFKFIQILLHPFSSERQPRTGLLKKTKIAKHKPQLMASNFVPNELEVWEWQLGGEPQFWARDLE